MAMNNLIRLQKASLNERIELLAFQLKKCKKRSEYFRISDCYVNMVKLQAALTIHENNLEIKELTKETGLQEGVIPLTKEFLSGLGFKKDTIEFLESIA
jgi:hypothetical protein